MTIEQIADAIPSMPNGAGHIFICPCCSAEAHFRQNGMGFSFDCEGGCEQEKIVDALGWENEDFARLLLDGLEIADDRRTMERAIQDAQQQPLGGSRSAANNLAATTLRSDSSEVGKDGDADAVRRSSEPDNARAAGLTAGGSAEKQTAPDQDQEPLTRGLGGFSDQSQNNGNHQVFQFETDDNVPSGASNVTTWKLNLSAYAQQLSIKENKLAQDLGIDRATYRQWALDDLRGIRERNPEATFLHPPAGLSETEIEEELQSVIDAYLPARKEDAAFEAGLSEVKDDDQTLRPLRLGQLYSLVDEWDRQPWVWDGILPRSSLSLIVGKSETGKSTMIYALIYSIIKGISFFGRKTEQGRVLYLAGDPMSEIVAGKTFRQLGLEPGEDIIVLPDALVANPTGLQQLRGIVRDFLPTLVIGDTMAATVAMDTDKYGQSYQVQQPLVKMARDFKPNFLMSHHSQKSAVESYSVIDAALGSVGVAAVASTRMGTKLHRRRGEKFYTWEMSSCRIGQPIEGEWIVHRYESGLCELSGLWATKTVEMDKKQIVERLERKPEGMAKRTLWNDLKIKPKWQAFGDALDELVTSGAVEITHPKGRGGTVDWYRLKSGDSDGAV